MASCINCDGVPLHRNWCCIQIILCSVNVVDTYIALISWYVMMKMLLLNRGAAKILVKLTENILWATRYIFEMIGKTREFLIVSARNSCAGITTRDFSLCAKEIFSVDYKNKKLNKIRIQSQTLQAEIALDWKLSCHSLSGDTIGNFRLMAPCFGALSRRNQQFVIWRQCWFSVRALVINNEKVVTCQSCSHMLMYPPLLW